MRIVGIVGSPRGVRGNTAGLLEIVLESARSHGAEAETIVLPGGSVLPCKACDTCHKKGECPQKDDFESIKKKIFEADGLVLASPNYILSVSAQMKAFMDRCCGVIHCLAFEGKYGASVVTSGGGPEEPIADYLNQFLMMTGVTPVGSVCATMWGGDTFDEATRNDALELGEKLVQLWNDKVTLPEIEKARDEFKQRMQALMLSRREEWPYEWEYWQTHYGLT